jgi:NAD+ kinase
MIEVSFESVHLLWFNHSMSSQMSPPSVFSRIALIGKFQAEGMDEVIEHLSRLVKLQGCRVFLEEETAKNTDLKGYDTIKIKDIQGQIDAIIVIGGDGTLLGVGRHIAGTNIPVIGINMGRLGYMTDIPLQDVAMVLPPMLAGKYQVDSRNLIEASVIQQGQVTHHGLALNDVVVNRSSHTGMVELAVKVNGSFMYNQRSDGLIVATTTGSTAYSLSAGGPILHPRIDGVVLTPIAPHALSNRAIVLPSDVEISIEVAGGKHVSAHFDMQSLSTLHIGDQVIVKKSLKQVTLLHPQGHSDYRTLREKLHWNEYPSSF